MEMRIGTKVYYFGNQASYGDFGTISNIIGDYYSIKLDDGREIKLLPLCSYRSEHDGERHYGYLATSAKSYNRARRAQLAKSIKESKVRFYAAQK